MDFNESDSDWTNHSSQLNVTTTIDQENVEVAWWILILGIVLFILLLCAR